MHDDDELQPVGGHDRHAVVGADARGEQMAGEGVGQAVEVGEGPAVVAGPERVAVAEPGRGTLEALVDQCPRSSETVFSNLRSASTNGGM